MSDRIAVIGGSGQIGTTLVATLRSRGHDVVAASRATGVDTVSGSGLAEALHGVSAVVDVSNLRSGDADALLGFFEDSTRNLLAAEADAGVRHHVALSVVGADRMPGSPYMRAKMAQEALIAGSVIPSTIVRATQFFEFVGRIADAFTSDGAVRVPPALIQPIAADDVAAALARVALGEPQGMIDVGGPAPWTFEALLRRHLDATDDRRDVIVDPEARYFGAALEERTLIPSEGASLAETTYLDWLASR